MSAKEGRRELIGARRFMRKRVDAWEHGTGELLEALLRNPRVLQPGSRAFTTVMKLKRLSDRALRAALRAAGLPTRAEQERAIYLLYEVQSKLMDLEEKVEAGQLAAEPPATLPEPRSTVELEARLARYSESNR